MNNSLLSLLLSALLIASAGLTGCATVEGAGETIENAGERIQDAADDE